MKHTHRLRNPIQNYDWGSHTVLAEMLGRPSPSPHPQAELWLGAHPRGRSIVVAEMGELPLDQLVAANPTAYLGHAVRRAFDGRLPFMLKVLAVERPLSLQVHPDAERARAGFARENAAGIPLDGATRSYPDARAKPELLCALSRFELLHGFRSDQERRQLGAALGLAALAAPAALDAIDGARRSAAGLLALLDRANDTWHAPLAAWLERPPAEEPAAGRWIRRLAAQHPGDPGALAPLFMNLVTLEPGEAIYTAPGALHTALLGTGVELLAASDNVVRGALTRKHTDLVELAEVVDQQAAQPFVMRAPGQAVALYDPPALELRLLRLALSPGTDYQAGAGRAVELILCTRGELAFASEERSLALRSGQSLLVGAAAPTYRVSGSGQAFVGTVQWERLPKALLPWEEGPASEAGADSERDEAGSGAADTDPEYEWPADHESADWPPAR